MKETAKKILYFIHGLRWQSRLGLVFIGIGLFLLFFQVFQGERQLNSLRTQLSKAREQKVTLVDVLPEPDVHEELYALLPKQGHANEQIAEILGMASEHNLLIEKASYAIPKISDSSLSKHQIRMPLNGSYTQIRHFVNQILNQHANVALNEVNFAREDISSEIVSANILLTLYLK